MPRLIPFILAALVTIAVVAQAERASAQAPEKNPAITPQPRIVEW
jgi:hypothetical protein